MGHNQIVRKLILAIQAQKNRKRENVKIKSLENNKKKLMFNKLILSLNEMDRVTY